MGQSKLSAVLRTYKDALIANIKSTIKTVVAELLPILFTRSPDAGEVASTDRQADMDGLLFLQFHTCAGSDIFSLLLFLSFKFLQHTMISGAGAKGFVHVSIPSS